jgi:hypothetical protein
MARQFSTLPTPQTELATLACQHKSDGTVACCSEHHRQVGDEQIQDAVQWGDMEIVFWAQRQLPMPLRRWPLQKDWIGAAAPEKAHSRFAHPSKVRPPLCKTGAHQSDQSVRCETGRGVVRATAYSLYNYGPTKYTPFIAPREGDYCTYGFYTTYRQINVG